MLNIDTYLHKQLETTIESVEVGQLDETKQVEILSILSSFSKPNSRVSIIKYCMVGTHENIPQDPVG